MIQLVHQLLMQLLADLLWRALQENNCRTPLSSFCGHTDDLLGPQPENIQTHKGQRSLIDVTARPGVPVDLGGGPGYNACPALTL